jgi:hypothetical protein
VKFRPLFAILAVDRRQRHAKTGASRLSPAHNFQNDGLIWVYPKRTILGPVH